MPAAPQVTTVSSITTGGVALATRTGVLHVVMLHPAAAGTTTLTIYDNASAASGTKLIDNMQAQNGWTNSVDLQNVMFKNGLWAVLTGGATATVQVTIE